ncbi:MAG TPA: hypothetical protein PL033_17210 [Candidatus Brocadiia bacterium]|nr:hypothetical protein [Candidatus Brocadiia bacterium]
MVNRRKTGFGVALVMLVTCWVAAASARAADAAKVLPDGTIAVAQVANYPQFMTRLKTRSIYKMYQDPEVQKFLEGVIENVKMGVSTAEEEVGIKLDELEGALTGEMAVALCSFDVETQQLEVILLANCAGKETEAKDILSRLKDRASKEGVEFKDETVEGVTVTRIIPPGMSGADAGVAPQDEVVEEDVIELGEEENKLFTSPPAIYYAVAGNYVILDVGTVDSKHAALDKVLASISGKGAGCLADSAAYKDACGALAKNTAEAMKQIGDADAAAAPDVQMYLNMGPLMDLLYKQTQEGIVRAEDVIAALGFKELKSVVISGLMREKYNISQILVHMPGEKTGLAKVMGQPLTSTTPPNFVPANVNSYGAMSFDMADFFQQILSLVEQINPGIHAQVVGQLQMLAANEAAPFDIEKELFGAMGSQIHVFTLPVEEKADAAAAAGPMAQVPPFVLVMDTKDKEALRGGLDKMFQLARGLVSVTPRMVLGTKVYEIRMGAAGTEGAEPMLSYAFVENWIAFTTRADLMDALVQAVAEPKSPLAASAEFKAGVAALPKSLCTVQYKNTAADLEGLIKQLKGEGTANPMLQQLEGLGDLVDMDLCPSMATLKKYLTYTIAGTQPTAEGWFGISYSPEPAQ